MFLICIDFTMYEKKHNTADGRQYLQVQRKILQRKILYWALTDNTFFGLVSNLAGAF